MVSWCIVAFLPSDRPNKGTYVCERFSTNKNAYLGPGMNNDIGNRNRIGPFFAGIICR